MKEHIVYNIIIVFLIGALMGVSFAYIDLQAEHRSLVQAIRAPKGIRDQVIEDWKTLHQ